MTNFITGAILGSLLTASLGLAGGQLYNKQGQVQAPNHSQQQYDYFRQRQLFIDAANIERHGAAAAKATPCGK